MRATVQERVQCGLLFKRGCSAGCGLREGIVRTTAQERVQWGPLFQRGYSEDYGLREGAVRATVREGCTRRIKLSLLVPLLNVIFCVG